MEDRSSGDPEEHGDQQSGQDVPTSSEQDAQQGPSEVDPSPVVSSNPSTASPMDQEEIQIVAQYNPQEALPRQQQDPVIEPDRNDNDGRIPVQEVPNEENDDDIIPVHQLQDAPPRGNFDRRAPRNYGPNAQYVVLRLNMANMNYEEVPLNAPVAHNDEAEDEVPRPPPSPEEESSGTEGLDEEVEGWLSESSSSKSRPVTSETSTAEEEEDDDDDNEGPPTAFYNKRLRRDDDNNGAGGTGENIPQH